MTPETVQAAIDIAAGRAVDAPGAAAVTPGRKPRRATRPAQATHPDTPVQRDQPKPAPAAQPAPASPPVAPPADIPAGPPTRERIGMLRATHPKLWQAALNIAAGHPIDIREATAAQVTTAINLTEDQISEAQLDAAATEDGV